MRKYAKFFVTPKGERAARGGHPWVFGEEVTKIEGTYANGDLVDVVTSKGKYLGTGFERPFQNPCAHYFHQY